MFLLRGWCLLQHTISKALKIPATDNVTTLPPDCPGWLAPFHDLFSIPSSQWRRSLSMSDGSTLSVVALSVALVALFIALGQLLGQYFATADGYRRCQSSVMGPWAKYTRLSWRWRQFRFETYFTTPQIIFLPDGHDSGRPRDSKTSTQDALIISDSKEVSQSIRDLYVLNEDGKKDEELVCWISLLQSLYVNRWKLDQCGCYTRLPQYASSPPPYAAAFKLRERSWDFMPPEIVRPVAITSISDIAIIARRLGMRWIDFRPEENTMRAEGNGHVLNSTVVRSVGIILQYMQVEDSSSSTEELYIPTNEADMMGFGILPPSNLIDRGPFRIGSMEEILTVMTQFDPTGPATKKARDTNAVGGKPFGFSDIIPLAAPMMRIRSSSIIRLPMPADHCDGLTSHKEGFVVFYQRLQEHINTRPGRDSDERKWVLDQYETLLKSYPEWEDEAKANAQGNNRSIDFLERVHDCHDYTTAYFLRLDRDHKFRYSHLVEAHIVNAVNYWGDAWQNIRDHKARYDPTWMRDWIAEGAHQYWDYLPRIVSSVTQGQGRTRSDEKILIDEALAHEAWIMMMFRAMCWGRCHWMDLEEKSDDSGGSIKETRLPSRYWNSKVQVYVG